jgi:hypothetical protein
VRSWGARLNSPSAPVTPLQAFWVVLALAFVALACWSFANPLVSAPDEQAHMIRAYALDHGQLGHSLKVAGNGSEVEVTVPRSVYFTKIYPQCFQFQDKVPATCAPTWTTATQPIATNTYVGHYPPLYYLIAGVGGWFSAGPPGLYLMRLVSALASALMLALAAYVVVRFAKRRMIAAGLAAAMTPIVWFLAASVNPSGLEITTAIALWTALSVMVTDYVEDPPRALVRVVTLSASVLVLIRGLSPLWVVLIGAVAALVAGPRRLLATVRRRRDMQVGAGIIVLSALLAAAWIFTQGTLHIAPDGAKVPPGTSEFGIIKLVAHQINFWVRQMVGVLGWLDTPFPPWLYHLWELLIALLAVGGVIWAAWRSKIALVATTALVILVPVILVTRQVHQFGIVWQGRDSMPMAVGVPILGSALWPRTRTKRVQRWIGVGVIALIALLNMGAFYLNLKRYSVGRIGSRFYFLQAGNWSPPTGLLETLLVYGVTIAVLAVLAAGWLLARGSRAGADA